MLHCNNAVGLRSYDRKQMTMNEARAHEGQNFADLKLELENKESRMSTTVKKDQNSCMHLQLRTQLILGKNKQEHATERRCGVQRLVLFVLCGLSDCPTLELTTG